MLESGLSCVDITTYEPGISMMGWGMLYNQAQGVARPLHARALVVRQPSGSCFAFVVTELLLVTQGLTLGVIEVLERDHPELQIGRENLAIVATHTHSGPSGFAHHFFINLCAPGFSALVYDHLVTHVVKAIVDAHADLAPAKLVVTEGEVPKSAGITFNRSWFAYSRNVEVSPIPRERRDEAVRRTMTVLRVEAPDGTLRGSINWFALHGTCVHAHNDLLHPDHKGVLSSLLENDGAIAISAQECCGDISPNHRPSDRGYTIGPLDDDFECADMVGQAQYEVARELIAAAGESLTGPVASRTLYVDFRSAPADARFVAEGQSRTTRPARLGLAMAMGTAEGPGPLWPVRRLLKWTHSLIAALLDDPKLPLIELASGAKSRVIGFIPMRWVPPLDPVLRWIGTQVRAGRAGDESWISQQMPVQLFRIGSTVICTLPFEPTTIAGQRLRETLLEVTPPEVTRAIISPYANAYAGYLTTREEYTLQHYEAGYTLFGPHSLAAVRTAVVALAETLEAEELPSIPLPQLTPRARLEAMAFDEPWPM